MVAGGGQIPHDPAMEKIKHIVYLMLENRSFDNVLGWLYDPECDDLPATNIPPQEPTTFDGLKTSYYNLDKDGNKHCVTQGTRDNSLAVPSWDPHEEFQFVNNQIFESKETPTKPVPPAKSTATMGGFYKDFATFWDDPAQIMASYTRDELPAINGLARAYAVSDEYFSSVPTQTNCNRAFAAAGNSLGLNDDGELEAWVNNRGSGLSTFGQPAGPQFNQQTMWNVLSDNGKDSPGDWMIYHSEGTWLENKLGVEGYNYTRDLMEQIQPAKFDPHFDSIDTFFDRAEAGTLPSVCFLEPKWGLTAFKDWGINGNDYHPPTNLGPGEVFLKSIYDALTSNKEAWEQTLFIVNFDEHGGTYDHVCPPWTAAQPWANGDMPEPTKFERDFKFDRFGVRVPLILASPWIDEKVVFRSGCETPYDHTSVIATILHMMGIDKSEWKLGSRVEAAPRFDNVLARTSPRSDIPPIGTNPNWQPCEKTEAPPNDIQRRMASSLLVRAAKRLGVGGQELGDRLGALEKARSASGLAELLKSHVEGIGGE